MIDVTTSIHRIKATPADVQRGGHAVASTLTTVFMGLTVALLGPKPRR